jgi:sugar transferase (PEP-CTERM system associated)
VRNANLFGFGKRNILILGTGKRASIIEKRMRRKVDRQGFVIKGFIHMDGDTENGIQQEKKMTLEPGNLADYTYNNKIDEIVVACDERRGNPLMSELFKCKIRGTKIIEILDFIERETGQVAVNLVYPSWIIYSNGFNSNHQLRTIFDRVFNAIVALSLILVTWPAMLLTMLLIKLEDGLNAPTLYKQIRVGLNGKPFEIIKFRSMSLDAEKESGAKWASKHDSRTTKIGGIIRKYRIDELPQLYNVLIGQMGIVGPRPERPEFTHELTLTIPYYNERHNVKPGLTGWAQLKYPYGSTEEDAMEKLKYDLYYIKHRSFLFDMHILFRTIETVLFGKGL